MKKSFILSLIFVLLVGVASAQTTLLSAWTFDDLPEAPNTPLTFPSNFGEQSGSAFIYADGSNGSDLFASTASSPEITSFGGYTDNDPRTPPISGRALAIANMSANDKGIVFKLSTAGFGNLVITFAIRGTSTGFNTHVWSYSTNGSSFTDIPGNNTSHNAGGTTPVVMTVDLSSVTAINDQPNVYIKLTVSGATNSSGNNRFDNFQFNATPAGPDLYPPKLLSYEVPSATNIRLTFNEALNQSIAQTVTNYVLSGTSEVTTASLTDERIVNLTVSPGMTEGDSYTLTIKNIEDVASNTMADSALSLTFGIPTSNHIATIAGLKAVAPEFNDGNNPGTEVFKYTGEAKVTFITPYSTSSQRQIYVQDATGGIMIYEYSPAYSQNIEVGDAVSNVYGTLTNYFGLIEMIPTATVLSSSFGNSVQPQIVPITEMDWDPNNTLQCKLIELQQVSFNTTANFEAAKYYDLVNNGVTYDSLVSTTTMSSFNADYIGTAIPTHVVDLIGVVNFTYGKNRIIIRDKNGITSVDEMNMAAFKLSPNPAHDFVNIETGSDVKMDIFSISGQLISSGQYEAGSHIIPVSSMSQGMYIIKFTNLQTGSAYSSKLIVR